MNLTNKIGLAGMNRRTGNYSFFWFERGDQHQIFEFLVDHPILDS